MGIGAVRVIEFLEHLGKQVAIIRRTQRERHPPGPAEIAGSRRLYFPAVVVVSHRAGRDSTPGPMSYPALEFLDLTLLTPVEGIMPGPAYGF
jgi:hypothetical protein